MRPLLLSAGLAFAAPAAAQTITVKSLAEARLRYEGVAQDGVPRDADAVTMRVRTGVQAAAGAWSVLVEAQANLAIVGDYYDGIHGVATRPLVGDPQNVELYRAQLQYRSKALAMTAGRQRIVLDDERFVAAGPFRQDGQTFDAVRPEWTGAPGLKADVTYAWSVRTICGIDGVGARPQAIGGDNWLVNVSYRTPIGTATAVAYLVDQDKAAVQGFRLSSQTYGARLAGARALSPAVTLSYQLGYARQSDYRRNPSGYAADYRLADAAVEVHAVRIGGGYEVLGRQVHGDPAERRPRRLRQRGLRLESGGSATRRGPAGGAPPVPQRPADPSLWQRGRPARQRETGPHHREHPLCRSRRRVLPPTPSTPSTPRCRVGQAPPDRRGRALSTRQSVAEEDRKAWPDGL